jgi:uncharacterized protein (TIGR02996 family)
VTTEVDFQRMLDANPYDHDTRLVFADWLEDHDNEKAEGYRALGRNQIAPSFGPLGRYWWVGNESTPILANLSYSKTWTHYRSLIPDDWFKLVIGGEPFLCWWKFRTRSEAENALAQAFVRLPAERRAELLNPKVSP